MIETTIYKTNNNSDRTSNSNSSSSWKISSAYRSEDEFRKILFGSEQSASSHAVSLLYESDRKVDRIDYREQGGPLLQYLWCMPGDISKYGEVHSNSNLISKKSENNNSLLAGQTLYLGSALSSDARFLFHIPGHAERVLLVDTTTDTCSLIGPCFKGKYKWLRGITVGEYIFGLPCSAPTVLLIHVPSQSVKQIPIPYSEFYQTAEETSEEINCPWKYHGGAISPIDANIYCIPQSAKHVLQINPSTMTCQLIGPPLCGKYKWYGGTVGKKDGAIYGIPHNSPHVLRILPTKQIDCSCVGDAPVSVTLHGNVLTKPDHDENEATDSTCTPMNSSREHLWHGAADALDGTIVCVPANADSVLCIYPQSPNEEPEIVQIGSGSILSPGRHRTDRKYKYLGAIGCDANNKVYCFPCAAERVLEVDPVRRTVREIGPNLYWMERICQNKWQNGVYLPKQQCIVAIPLAAESVLIIDCRATSSSTEDSENEPIVTVWPLAEPYRLLGKFEGAITVPKNGNDIVYCVPNCHKAVLRIELPLPTTTDVIIKSKSTTTTAFLAMSLPEPTIVSSEQDSNSVLDDPTTTHSQCQALTMQNQSPPDDENGNRLDEGSNRKTSNNSHKSKNGKFHKHDRADYDSNMTAMLLYKSGIPTLRSSAHRVKYNPKLRKHDPKPKDHNGIETGTLWLPSELCAEDVFSFDQNLFEELKMSLIAVLRRCDPSIVGQFRTENNTDHLISSITRPPPTDAKTKLGDNDPNYNYRLEDFVVPIQATWRKVNGGSCEEAQKYLSDMVASDDTFLNLFDEVVQKAVIPYLKTKLNKSLRRQQQQHQRLPDDGEYDIDIGSSDCQPLKFYYQRPPTIRFQPGPAWAQVKPHNDAEYGHQNGELNFWLPFTDRDLTGVDLWCERMFGADDYHPVVAYPGEIVSFHGSSCRHYVNTNSTPYTRVSMDFRVGVQGYFDPYWQMIGTSDDHGRQEIIL